VPLGADVEVPAVLAALSVIGSIYARRGRRQSPPEDPVTGSAHCALAPYWAGRLHKTAFFAFQASRRGGEIRCGWAGDRVELEGSCVFYMQGEAEI
jgi:predicted PhzF superfamily epimerase YddE/YHI9